MQKLKNISDSEYVIMQVLWDKNPVSSAEIVSSLKDATGWDPKTIHTFLRRLMSKGIVNALKEGSFYKYSPNISRSEYTISETKSFVKKIYDGSISNLIISFVKQEELSKEEVKKLKEILEAAERES
jgi:BlaI family transcriptional regulator, penicillinase repressor